VKLPDAMSAMAVGEPSDLVERNGKTERHLQIDDQAFSYGAPGAKKL